LWTYQKLAKKNKGTQTFYWKILHLYESQETEEFCLLRYNTMQSSESQMTFQGNLLSPKCWLTFTRLHGTISQKTEPQILQSQETALHCYWILFYFST
jgi:hypothetical protein